MAEPGRRQSSHRDPPAPTWKARWDRCAAARAIVEGRGPSANRQRPQQEGVQHQPVIVFAPTSARNPRSAAGTAAPPDGPPRESAARRSRPSPGPPSIGVVRRQRIAVGVDRLGLRDEPNDRPVWNCTSTCPSGSSRAPNPLEVRRTPLATARTRPRSRVSTVTMRSASPSCDIAAPPLVTDQRHPPSVHVTSVTSEQVADQHPSRGGFPAQSRP